MIPIIPHKGKMLLLSRIIKYDLNEKTLCAEYDITEDCIFYNPAIGGVPSFVGFEFIAQSIAAFSGIKEQKQGKDAKIGFILRISSMSIDIPFFEAGCTVQIKVKEIDCMDQLFNFEGEIFCIDKKVMNGKLTIIEKKDI